jgi:RimJ/RimL family protein N-acetyltransferase
MLHEWLRRPHVAEWWGTPGTLEELEAEHAPAIDGGAAHAPYIVLLDERPIGYIQSYVASAFHDEGWWLDEHDPGVRGIDQFIAEPALIGRGIGSAMVRAFVDMLFVDPAVTRVQTDPAPGNGRAIRCYEKAGFRRVGVVETRDGPALLMYRDREPPIS